MNDANKLKSAITVKLIEDAFDRLLSRLRKTIAGKMLLYCMLPFVGVSLAVGLILQLISCIIMLFSHLLWFDLYQVVLEWNRIKQVFKIR